ncbi:MAG: hypothetical protein H6815_01980 [Phycisphaeraceae bacterium]|nr:hypothetical protein [Phycisphaerales bacterium]MCB9859198.1 hypothetical protein [Phycisphaeraceae bacterium]
MPLDDGEETARLYKEIATKLSDSCRDVAWLELSYDGFEIPLNIYEYPIQPYPNAPLLQDVLDSFEAAQPDIEKLIEVTRRPVCTLEHADMNDENDPAHQRVIEVASSLRKCVKVLACDAIRHQGLGNEEAAVERILAVYRLSNHLMLQEDWTFLLIGMGGVDYARGHANWLIRSSGKARVSDESCRRIRRVVKQIVDTSRVEVREKCRAMAHWLHDSDVYSEDVKQIMYSDGFDEDIMYDKWLKSIYASIHAVDDRLDPYRLQSP